MSDYEEEKIGGDEWGENSEGENWEDQSYQMPDLKHMKSSEEHDPLSIIGDGYKIIRINQVIDLMRSLALNAVEMLAIPEQNAYSLLL